MPPVSRRAASAQPVIAPFPSNRLRNSAVTGALVALLALAGCRTDVSGLGLAHEGDAAPPGSGGDPPLGDPHRGNDAAALAGDAGVLSAGQDLGASATPDAADRDQSPPDAPRASLDGTSPRMDRASGSSDLGGAVDQRAPSPDLALPSQDSNDPPPDLASPDVDSPNLLGDAAIALDLAAPPLDTSPAPPDLSSGCPALGTSAGAGCANAGAQACGGMTLLSCTADPSGCQVWTQFQDCAATGLVCSLPAGIPTCQCPAPTGSDVFVDPVAGSDTGSQAPNGADAPESCRFKTLTRGLMALDANRTRVVAKSASTSAATPATFVSGETFPLVVPAGATLTTADPTPTPANYTIAFNGASANKGVTLGAGATFSGFTVSNQGGALGATAVECTTGTVTIRNVTLVGGASASATKQLVGLAVGTSAGDTCTGTFTGLTVSGFATGARVETGSTTAAQLNDSTLRDNTTGLTLVAGPVTSNKLTIERSSGGLATGGVLIAGSSPTRAPRLQATDLRVRAVSGVGIDVTAPPDTAAAQVTLTAGRIENTADLGLRVAGGTCAMTGTTVTGAGTGRNGLIDGVAILGGTTTLKQARIEMSRGRGVYQVGGVLVIDDDTRIRDNGTGGVASGVRHAAGTLTIGSASAAPVQISGSSGSGLTIDTDAGTGTSQVTATRAEIHDNQLYGVRVDYVPSTVTGTTSISGGTIYKNGNGIYLRRAASPGGGTPGATVSGVTIRENGNAVEEGIGVWLASRGELNVSLANNTIRANRAYGVLVERDDGNTVSVAMTGNDVNGNNTGAGYQVGGVLFRAGVLTAFSGNKVHANGGIELGFDAAPDTALPIWDITGGGAGGNQIWCYGPGSVGLRLQAPAWTTVDARGLSWANANPALNTDFSGSVGTIFFVNPAAAATATPCP